MQLLWQLYNYGSIAALVRYIRRKKLTGTQTQQFKQKYANILTFLF